MRRRADREGMMGQGKSTFNCGCSISDGSISHGSISHGSISDGSISDGSIYPQAELSGETARQDNGSGKW